jgi:hypothetical protein
MAGFAAAVGFGRDNLADTIEMFRMLGPVQRQAAMRHSLPLPRYRDLCAHVTSADRAPPPLTYVTRRRTLAQAFHRQLGFVQCGRLTRQVVIDR